MKRWSVEWKNDDPTWRGPRAGIVHVNAETEDGAREAARERSWNVRLRRTKIVAVRELKE